MALKHKIYESCNWPMCHNNISITDLFNYLIQVLKVRSEIILNAYLRWSLRLFVVNFHIDL